MSLAADFDELVRRVAVVLDELPHGRFARQRMFESVEQAVAPFVASLRRQGIEKELSPILRTRAGAYRRSTRGVPGSAGRSARRTGS